MYCPSAIIHISENWHVSRWQCDSSLTGTQPVYTVTVSVAVGSDGTNEPYILAFDSAFGTNAFVHIPGRKNDHRSVHFKQASFQQVFLKLYTISRIMLIRIYLHWSFINMLTHITQILPRCECSRGTMPFPPFEYHVH